MNDFNSTATSTLIAHKPRKPKPVTFADIGRFEQLVGCGYTPKNALAEIGITMADLEGASDDNLEACMLGLLVSGNCAADDSGGE